MWTLGLNWGDVKRIVWTFIFAFFAALYATATGWSTLPNYSDGKAAIISAGLAALAAVLSFIKNFVMADSNPAK